MKKDGNKLSTTMRSKLFKDNKILISNLNSSVQKEDLTVAPNCNGLGRIRHFKIDKGENWSIDPLPNIPFANSFNIKAEKILETQVFQINACDFRCWFCFVDHEMLIGDTSFGKFITVKELLAPYLKDKNRPKVLDLSGGQPNLVPEWLFKTIKEIESAQLSKDIYIWMDDNLSNYHYWEFLTKEQREYISNYKHLGRVGCFKGIDNESFHFNTNAKQELYDEQFIIFNKLLQEKIDLYAYSIFTVPNLNNIKNKVISFIERLQSIHPNLPLRTVPLEIEIYTPNKNRVSHDYLKSIENQYIVHNIWKEELKKRYTTEEMKKTISNIDIGCFK